MPRAGGKRIWAFEPRPQALELRSIRVFQHAYGSRRARPADFQKYRLPKIIRKKKFRFFSIFLRIFRKLFVGFILSNIFPEIDGAETIRLVRKSSNFELSSRFFGRLKIFIGLGSLYSVEPIFQTPHYLQPRPSLLDPQTSPVSFHLPSGPPPSGLSTLIVA